MSTFWEYAYSYPPCLVRLLARHPYGKPLTDAEICDSPGWTQYRFNEFLVHNLSRLTRWDDVSFYDMRRFLQGCKLDFCNPEQMRRVSDYLRKRPTFRYLRASPLWGSYYEPLMKTWRRSYPLDPPKDLDPAVRALLVRLTPLLTTKP
jgi:hypothetical protein